MALKLYHVFVLFTLCNTLQWCQEPHDLIISRRGTDCWPWYTFYHKQSDEVEQLGICIHFVKAYFTWSDASSLYMLTDAVWMRSITLFHQPCMTFTFTVTTFPTVTEIVWLFYQILSYNIWKIIYLAFVSAHGVITVAVVVVAGCVVVVLSPEDLAVQTRDQPKTTQQTQDVNSMLIWCWVNVIDSGPILNQHGVNILQAWVLPNTTQKTQDVNSMLIWCWVNVIDSGPILNQHGVNILQAWVLPNTTQKTQDVNSMLVWCWVNITDSGPVLNQPGISILSLLWNHLWLMMHCCFNAGPAPQIKCQQ